MHIKYQEIYDKSYEQAVRKISSSLYKKENNKLMIQDMIISFSYIGLLGWLCITLIDWYEIFFDWYESNFLIWLIVAIFISAYFTLFYFSKIRPNQVNKMTKNKVRTNLSGRESEVAILDKGLYHKSTICETLYFYSMIDKIEEIDQYLIIVISRAYLIVIPLSAFEKPEDQEQFYHLLTDKIRHENLCR